MLTSDRGAPPEERDDPPEAAGDPVASTPTRHRVALVVGAIGRLMITSGVVLLLLVAYQLWGTNLHTSRAQGELADQFATLVDDQAGGGPVPTPSPDPTPPSSTEPPRAEGPPEVAPSIAPPGVGEPIGNFSIPAIGVHRFWTVEGTGTAQLRRGAAHYPGTPLPGQAGNAAVAGHRTTYGAPLHNVEKLVPGDEITFETLQGTFHYAVRETKIVAPTAVEVIAPQNPTEANPLGDNLLTLTACHPKFSAAQRIVVVAELTGPPVPPLEGQEEAAAAALAATEELDGTIDAFATEPVLAFPGAWWGLLCVGLWALTRVAAHRLRRHRLAVRAVPYLVGTPVCLVVLFLFFGSVSYEGVARTLGLSI